MNRRREQITSIEKKKIGAINREMEALQVEREKIFTNPSQKQTEDYVTGRFG